MHGCLLLYSFCSGSVSSYNEDDYEVDENSDDEEQEEPEDYCKGIYRSMCSATCCSRFDQL